MIEITVCCDDCGMLGAAARTASIARQDLRRWKDRWVFRRSGGKTVDLCGPCARYRDQAEKEQG